ncbi:uncharacterized protein LOC132616199 [Lycium barbarum]|uniref:uncharacterized protein LOC132616199 n=1 Tax=Lycium barbarum TaxID=112863 RepID=UPI00293E0D9E|nr:uncharacterized protein LOC132616199 [Lycium barbarum]
MDWKKKKKKKKRYKQVSNQEFDDEEKEQRQKDMWCSLEILLKISLRKLSLQTHNPQSPSMLSSDKEIMAIKTGTPSVTGTPSAGIAPVATPTTRTAVPPAEKPAKFTGANFNGWQQRMFFWLTTLGMQKFTSEDPPVPATDMPDNQKFMVTEAWKQADFLCKGYILSALEDDLYNVYSEIETSKELWSALEKKYKIEDACLKKFVVAKFLDYKMVDGKTVGTQIEEDNKTAEKRYRKSSPIEGASVVEDVAPKKNNKRKRRSGKEKYPNKKKFKGNCYNCGKAGHKAPDCRAPKKDKEKNKGQANMVEDVDDLCAMLYECNLEEPSLSRTTREKWV